MWVSCTYIIDLCLSFVKVFEHRPSTEHCTFDMGRVRPKEAGKHNEEVHQGRLGEYGFQRLHW